MRRPFHSTTVRFYASALPALLAIACAPLAAQDVSLGAALNAYRQGDCATAAPAFDKILTAQPKNVRIRKLLADCQVRAGQMEAGRANYLEVLAVAPADAEARRALQAASAPPPKPSPKPKPVAPAPKPAPVRPEQTERQRAGGALEQAERLIEGGRLTEAEQRLEQIIASQPDAVIARQRLAEICSGSERFHQAANLYSVIAKRTGDAELYSRAAQNFSWATEYPDSIEHYRKYLDLEPGDTAAHLGLANALVWSGQAADATEHYEIYLRKHPDDLEARLNQSRALLAAGRSDEAQEKLAIVRRRRPDSPELALMMAQALEQSGDLSGAAEAYRAVLRANPQHAQARAAFDRLQKDVELRRGYKAIDEGRFEDAIEVFAQELARNPDSDAAMLQAARVYAWSERFPQAARHYRDYIARNPSDPAALRELARVELALPDFAAAQTRFERLVEGPFATTEDREGLLQSYLWSGDYEQAAVAAERLLEIDPTNSVAAEAKEQARSQTREELLDRARRLTAEANYGAALDAYQAFVKRYGSDKTVDLAVARIYAWDEQWRNAAGAYERYLDQFPNDPAARLELARVREWAGDYDQAEAEYTALARTTSPDDPDVLLGLAQISAYRGDDTFDVVHKYRQVLRADPNNEIARERYEQLGSEVSPSVGYELSSFNNSDDFGVASNALRATLPFRGGFKASPFYRYDYFRQARQVGGTVCGGAAPSGFGERALSDSICGADGIATAHVGGVQVDLNTKGFDFSAELGGARFDTGRNSLQSRVQMFARTGSSGRVGLSYTRRDAAYDVQTIAPLFAGILADSATLSYEQGLSKRWSAAFIGGATRYSQSQDGAFGTNLQRFGGARLNYKVTNSFTAGYYFRLTGFRDFTPVYFSPTTYGSAGGVWSWNRQVSDSVRVGVDAELGYGRIDRPTYGKIGTLEMMFRPEVLWRIQPDLALRTSYRYGRGSNSAFQASAYQTSVLEFRLESSFLDRISTPRSATGLVIR